MSIDNSASASSDAAYGVSNGTSSHVNTTLHANNTEEVINDRGLDEKVQSPTCSSNRVTNHGDDVPPELKETTYKADNEFANSKKKLVESHASNLQYCPNDESLEEHLDGSVDQYISQYKFETSIDERSLKSFLEISGSTPDRSEDSKDQPKPFSRGDGNIHGEGATLREIEYEEQQLHDQISDSDNSRATTRKRGSDSTAGSSDSYQTARQSLTDDKVPTDILNYMKELLTHEKRNETKLDQFETSIDEGSLRSFLALSGSSPEQTEAVQDGTSLSRRDGDLHDKGTTVREISCGETQQHQAGDSDNDNVVECTSDRTARTSDSYQTALEPLTHNDELPKEIRNSMGLSPERRDETKADTELQVSDDNEFLRLAPGNNLLSEEKSDETKAEAEMQVSDESESLCVASRNTPYREYSSSASELHKKEEGCKTEADAQNIKALTIQSPNDRSSKNSELQSASGNNGPGHARTSTPEGPEDLQTNERDVSQKRSDTNSSEQATRTELRTHTASTTEVKIRTAGLRDSVPQKYRLPSKTEIHSGDLTENQSCSSKKEGPLEQMRMHKPPKQKSSKRGIKSGMKGVNKKREGSIDEKRSSSANRVPKSGKRIAKNEGRSGISHLRSTRSARERKQEHKGVRKPKRHGGLNKLPIPRSKNQKHQKDVIRRDSGRRRANRKRQIAPIAFSVRNGICINGNALMELQEIIFREVSSMVSALDRKKQKGDRKENSKIGLKVVMLKNGK